MPLTRVLGVLLVMSSVNLALMVPGGFVETRSFPSYGIAVIGAFNVFLTLLGLGSLVLAYLVFRTGRAGPLPMLAGTAYVLVYGLDLLKIFPISKAPMSATLACMEWIGTFLGLAVIAVSMRPASPSKEQPPTGALQLPLWLAITLAVSTLAIVTFATLSAL